MTTTPLRPSTAVLFIAAAVVAAAEQCGTRTVDADGSLGDAEQALRARATELAAEYGVDPSTVQIVNGRAEFTL